MGAVDGWYGIDEAKKRSWIASRCIRTHRKTQLLIPADPAAANNPAGWWSPPPSAGTAAIAELGYDSRPNKRPA